MKLNPYLLANSIRIVLVAALLWASPALLFIGFGGDSVVTVIFFAVLAAIIIGIGVTSVLCTKYIDRKPAEDSKTAKTYRNVWIALILALGASIILSAKSNI